MTPLAARLAWHLRLAGRAGWLPAAVAAAGGTLLRILLPVTGAWLAAAAAAGCALAGICLAALDRRPLPPRGIDPPAALERMGTAGQVAHAFLRAAAVLGGLAAGLLAGTLAVQSQ